MALGVIGGIAASRANRGYYGGGGGYYGAYRPYGYYNNSYGYAAPYAPVASGLPFGAYSFVDEGDFRNYRDINGNYLGRIPLRDL